MGISKFIEKVCVQTLVYWSDPTPDGYGGMTFSYPVELPCRWTDKVRTKVDNTGVIITQKAEILLTQNVTEQGYMWLGLQLWLHFRHRLLARWQGLWFLNRLRKLLVGIVQ